MVMSSRPGQRAERDTLFLVAFTFFNDSLTKGGAMATNARTQYDALMDEMTATSPSRSSKMFGMSCLKNEHGKAFAGWYQEAMVFKLGGAAHTRALALPGARLFDPMHGRPMKAWVEVPAAHAALWLELAQAALVFVTEERA
jgi:hypothetical protein